MNIHRPKSQHAPEPEVDAEEMAAIEEGVAELDSGHRIPFEAVRAWVESWGTAEERPMPTATTASVRK